MPVKRHQGRHIIVVGTSAGGLEALDQLVGQLPTDLPASIFIVQHMAPHNTGQPLLRRLSRHQAFQPKLADDGELFKPGCIYIARPDSHLLLKARRVLVAKGARENRYRPGIDPLFRSAAVAHGAGVIGVVLTGMLDDGTAGLMAIKRCGGVAVVQDPTDAAYAGMPSSALANVDVDHCVRVAEMGPLLTRLVAERHGRNGVVPADIRTEATIAERVLSDVAQVNGLGTQVPYNCPNCGGVLWEIDTPGKKRYRCHTGHSYTGPALLASQSEKIEEILWISLRMFEERKNLLTSMSKATPHRTPTLAAGQRLGETQGYIDRVRDMLRAPLSHNADEPLTSAKGPAAKSRKTRSRH